MKKRFWLLLCIPVLLFAAVKASAIDENTGEGYFILDDQKEIEFSNGNARDIAKDIKLISEDKNEYDVIVNVKGDKKIVISPIEKVSKKLQIKNQKGYTVKNFEGNVYIQDDANLQKIAKHIYFQRPVTYDTKYAENSVQSTGTQSVKSTAKNESAKESKSEAGTTGDYSKTNIQTQGVDEADIVKTDGKYIYFVRDNKVSIVDANVQNLKKISEIKNESYNKNIVDIYIDKNMLTVMSNGYKDIKDGMTKSTTYIEVYDLTNIKNIQVIISR